MSASLCCDYLTHGPIVLTIKSQPELITIHSPYQYETWLVTCTGNIPEFSTYQLLKLASTAKIPDTCYFQVLAPIRPPWWKESNIYIVFIICCLPVKNWLWVWLASCFQQVSKSTNTVNFYNFDRVGKKISWRVLAVRNMSIHDCRALQVRTT